MAEWTQLALLSDGSGCDSRPRTGAKRHREHGGPATRAAENHSVVFMPLTNTATTSYESGEMTVVSPASRGVQKLDRHAAAEMLYSWIRPPSRSRRSMRKRIAAGRRERDSSVRACQSRSLKDCVPRVRRTWHFLRSGSRPGDDPVTGARPSSRGAIW
jgi:hypothetical protein